MELYMCSLAQQRSFQSLVLPKLSPGPQPCSPAVLPSCPGGSSTLFWRVLSLSSSFANLLYKVMVNMPPDTDHSSLSSLFALFTCSMTPWVTSFFVACSIYSANLSCFQISFSNSHQNILKSTENPLAF